MSADNYIGVRPSKDGTFTIEHGFMSPLSEDCQYQGTARATADTREIALVKAHDILKDEYIVEYGVIELDCIPDDPCGRCYVCVSEDRNVAPDLETCDACKEPLVLSQSTVLTQGGQFHGHCEPRG